MKFCAWSLIKQSFEGSFKGFIDEFHRRHHGQGSALDLVKMVVETFPSFRDQVQYQDRTSVHWLFTVVPDFNTHFAQFIFGNELRFLQQSSGPRSIPIPSQFLTHSFRDH